MARYDFRALLEFDKTIDAYPIANGKPGLCVIINQEKFDSPKIKDREGTRRDVNAIKRTFRSLKFTMDDDQHIFNDFSRKDLLAEMQKIASNQDLLSNADCFVCFILTHGREGNYLRARDERYKFDEIVNMFTADNCPALEGKPKIFMLQVSSKLSSIRFSNDYIFHYTWTPRPVGAEERSG